MKQLISAIKQLTNKINETEKNRKRLSSVIRERGIEGLIYRSSPDFPDDMRIVAVDGGIVKRSLHEFDCVLTRAAAVCFHYQKGSVVNVKYFPSRFPTPVPYIFETLADLDINYATSVSRLNEEINTALKSIERFKPDIILLDGLIVPHYSDKPSKSSSVYPDYSRLINTYKDLYKACLENNIILAGVIEDSRNTLFCNIIRDELKDLNPEFQKLLEKTRDTNLLSTLLKKGERTGEFKYTESIKEHPIVRDLEEYANDMYTFYLKTAAWDRPIKVDILTKKIENIEKLAGILLGISGQHSRYGLPVPLIEADNIARLSESEMENFYNNILSSTGYSPGLMKLRRDDRPF